MYTFFSNALLLAPNALGGIFLLLLVFTVCFLGVHIAKYAVLGWQAHNKPQTPLEKKEEKTAPTKPPEPVYYIVERKRKREKSKYYEPKEIHFK